MRPTFEDGAPLKVTGVATAVLGAIVARSGAGLSRVEDLKGRKVAAIVGTSTFFDIRALTLKGYGFDIQKDAQIVTATAPPDMVTLLAKGDAFDGVLKSGRTHLQDAVPITWGQVFTGYAEALRHGGEAVQAACAELRILGLGGTAVGTGLTAHPRFRTRVIRELGRLTGERLEPARSTVMTTWSLRPFAGTTASLRGLAIDLAKICLDLRLLSSGPHTGLAELRLPTADSPPITIRHLLTMTSGLRSTSGAGQSRRGPTSGTSSGTRVRIRSTRTVNRPASAADSSRTARSDAAAATGIGSTVSGLQSQGQPTTAASRPQAEHAAAEALSLPIYPELGDEGVERVTESIRAFFGN